MIVLDKKLIGCKFVKLKLNVNILMSEIEKRIESIRWKRKIVKVDLREIFGELFWYWLWIDLSFIRVVDG